MLSFISIVGAYAIESLSDNAASTLTGTEKNTSGLLAIDADSASLGCKLICDERLTIGLSEIDTENETGGETDISPPKTTLAANVAALLVDSWPLISTLAANATSGENDSDVVRGVAGNSSIADASAIAGIRAEDAELAKEALITSALGILIAGD